MGLRRNNHGLQCATKPTLQNVFYRGCTRSPGLKIISSHGVHSSSSGSWGRCLGTQNYRSQCYRRCRSPWSSAVCIFGVLTTAWHLPSSCRRSSCLSSTIWQRYGHAKVCWNDFFRKWSWADVVPNRIDQRRHYYNIRTRLENACRAIGTELPPPAQLSLPPSSQPPVWWTNNHSSRIIYVSLSARTVVLFSCTDVVDIFNCMYLVNYLALVHRTALYVIWRCVYFC